MAPDLRSKLLAPSASRFRREPVTLEGVDEPLFVRQLSAREMQAQIKQVRPEGPKKGKAAEEEPVDGVRYAASFVIATLVGADGRPVFQAGDEEALMDAFPFEEIMRLQTAAMKINRFNEEIGAAKNA